MFKEPLISVIIPVYNSARTLDKCIESIANQSYKNWELILVDSYSKDATPQIIMKWVKHLGKEKCKYYNVTKKTQTAKRNFGITQAQGSLLFFLDSDQYLSLTAFEECLKLIEEGYDGVHIPQVPLFKDKSYFSKCNVLSIEFFTFDKSLKAPSMVKRDHVDLLYQEEDMDWVDDSLTIERYKQKNLKIASTRLPLIHDRDISMRSLILKTRFSVLASKKQSQERIVDSRFIDIFAKKMLWLIKSQPIYLPGILLAFSLRIFVRMMIAIQKFLK